MNAVALLAVLAAICGLVASSMWVRLATVAPASPVRSKRLLGQSAIATALCLGLASLAALLAVFPL